MPIKQRKGLLEMGLGLVREEGKEPFIFWERENDAYFGGG